MKNIAPYQKKLLKKGLLLSVSSCVVLVMTSFNPFSYVMTPFSREVVRLHLAWYDLFLLLEQQDACAFPPIAARRASEMGIAGYYTFIQNQPHFTGAKPSSVLLLNEVYATVLHNAFTDAYSRQKIRQLYSSTRSRFKHVPDDIKQQVTCEAGLILERLSSITPGIAAIDNTTDPIPENTDRCLLFSSPSPLMETWQYQDIYLTKNKQITLPNPWLNNRKGKTPFSEQSLAVFHASQGLDEEKKWIADFWSDDVRGLTFSPPDRWISITNQLVQQYPLVLKDLFTLYAKLGIGLNDAVTLCWKYKYQYRVSRPSVFIKNQYQSTWTPYHDNPSFPSYPSGHAVIGGLASNILASCFGDTLSFTDISHRGRIEFRRQDRHYSSLSSMAEENALSRIYMGVHFPIDCSAGMTLGREVGANINSVDLDAFLHSKRSIHPSIYCSTEGLTTYK